MARIEGIRARWVLDSRGNPTVEAEVILDNGIHASGIAPSGASTGTHEAVELRDNDPGRFLGKGVDNAVRNAEQMLAAALRGRDPGDQEALDRRMIEADGTGNKSNAGANAMLALSIACARAAAFDRKQPLYGSLGGDREWTMPVPFMNVINGGRHAPNTLAIQEFMIVPHGFGMYAEALRAGAEVYQHLGRLLKERGMNTAVGDEGGFAPDLGHTAEALSVLAEAIGRAGYEPGEQVALALDCAATEFHFDEGYILGEEGRTLSPAEMAGWLADLCAGHPHLASIEDGMAEDDWDGWKLLTKRIGKDRLLVGDDIFVTNRKLLDRGIAEKAANAILIKPNQIGTLSETADVVVRARECGFATVMSHRSGETEDPVVADLAVAYGVGKIKAGAPCRSDRTAKYNRLLRIAEETGAPLADFAA